MFDGVLWPLVQLSPLFGKDQTSGILISGVFCSNWEGENLSITDFPQMQYGAMKVYNFEVDFPLKSFIYLSVNLQTVFEPTFGRSHGPPCSRCTIAEQSHIQTLFLSGCTVYQSVRHSLFKQFGPLNPGGQTHSPVLSSQIPPL